MHVFYPDSETLGILVCERPGDPPFAESSFLRSLNREGERLGIQVFAFDPRSWREDDNTVLAWRPSSEHDGWSARRERLPSGVYDRAWPETAGERVRFRASLRKIADRWKLIRLNGMLPGKAAVQRILAPDPEIRRILPPVSLYRGSDSLLKGLERHEGAVFLKPDCGSQGRGTAELLRLPDGTCRIRGRRHDNLPFTVHAGNWEEASVRLARWIGSRTYLIQPLLSLTAPDGEPFDIRVLVQKDGSGRWSVTGIAARCGRAGSVTANLHGGGRAWPAEEKLAGLYGPVRAAEILQEIKKSCRAAVRRIERHFGRFAELGLDFGVDRAGRLWFLEANSKPGRASMAAASSSAEENAVARPVAYARSILLRPPGRVIHEFDHL